MASAQKREEKPAETLTPMMQQTQEMVRQQLIGRGRKPEAADMIIAMASVQLKGKDSKLPPKLREDVSEARDMLYFMPRLMKKGYNADEAFSMVDAARHPIDMTFFSSNRIEDYDVSALKERFDYIKSHKNEDYLASMAGVMFKGPLKTPPLREKAPPAPKSEVAERQEAMKLGGRLAMVPRKLKPERGSMDFTMDDVLFAKGKKAKEAMEFTLAETEPAAAKPKESEKPVEKVERYNYDLDIYGAKYSVTLNRELKGKSPKEIRADLSDLLAKEPAAILSMTTPTGEGMTKKSNPSEFDRNVAYMKSVVKPGSKEIKVTQNMVFTEEEVYGKQSKG